MKMSYLEAVTDALDTAMALDPDVIVMGEDVGVYGGGSGATRGLIQKYGPERVMDTPISETSFTGAAVGCAILGMKPVVEIIFSDFMTLALDPIMNHAAKMHFMSAGTINVPIVVRTPMGAGTGAAAQHSQSVENMFMNIPGLIVIAPSSPADAKGLLLSAIECPDPVIFLEHKLSYKHQGEVPRVRYVLPIGKAGIPREGRDITIISYSEMVNESLKAAELLCEEGISAEVVDLRTLRPLDRETVLESVSKTGRALIVTESPVFGGFSGEIASMINEGGVSLRTPVRRLGGADSPIAYSETIESRQIPHSVSIAAAAKEMVRSTTHD